MTADMTVSSIVYAVEGGFRRPGFFHPDQALVLNTRMAEDRPDAFTSRNITATGLLERELGKGITLNGGLGMGLLETEQLGREQEFRLFYLPAGFTWDTSDELLDPTSGGRLNLQLTPYYNIYGEDLGFLKGYVSYSRYIQIVQDPRLVLAARGTLGTISGADRDEIPPDIRFYAGGGGSIRGYAY